MSLEKVASLSRTFLTSCLNPAYLRHLAQASNRWGWARARRPLKTVSLESLTTQPHEVRLWRMPTGSFGDSPLTDLMVLCTLVRMRRPKNVFEFGTFRGLATLQLALNTEESTRIFTLDIPPEKRSTLTEGGWDAGVSDSIIGELYRNSPYASRVTQILCDSRELDTTPYAGQMDFIFIDASHEYEFVKNDSEKAFQMVSRGGIIAWHDYAETFHGVRRYLEELARTREVCWVKDTWVAFCKVD